MQKSDSTETYSSPTAIKLKKLFEKIRVKIIFALKCAVQT